MGEGTMYLPAGYAPLCWGSAAGYIWGTERHCPRKLWLRQDLCRLRSRVAQTLKHSPGFPGCLPPAVVSDSGCIERQHSALAKGQRVWGEATRALGKGLSSE